MSRRLRNSTANLSILLSQAGMEASRMMLFDGDELEQQEE